MFYCTDIPSLIKAEITKLIETKAPRKSEYYFNLMYSLYCFPNILLPIMSGMLIDRIGKIDSKIANFQGYNIPNIIFCGLIFLGNFIVYLGLRVENVILLLLGRFVYGLGGESLAIGMSALVVRWFKGKELAFAQVNFRTNKANLIRRLHSVLEDLEVSSIAL